MLARETAVMFGEAGKMEKQYKALLRLHILLPQGMPLTQPLHDFLLHGSKEHHKKWIIQLLLRYIDINNSYVK